MRGRDCSVLWARDYPLLSDGHGSVAVADLDGDGAPEIVTIDSEQRVVVFDHSGNLLATAPEPLREMNPLGHELWSAPAIAEIDGVRAAGDHRGRAGLTLPDWSTRAGRDRLEP